MNKCVGAKQTEIKKVLTIVQQLAMHRPGVVYNPSVVNRRDVYTDQTAYQNRSINHRHVYQIIYNYQTHRHP